MNYAAYQRLDGENTDASNPCAGFSKKGILHSLILQSGGNLISKSQSVIRLASSAASAHRDAMPKPPRIYGPSDLPEIWQGVEKRLEKMSKAEILQTLVSAGILTPKGNPTKPYRGAFRKIPATKG